MIWLGQCSKWIVLATNREWTGDQGRLGARTLSSRGREGHCRCPGWRWGQPGIGVEGAGWTQEVINRVRKNHNRCLADRDFCVSALTHLQSHPTLLPPWVSCYSINWLYVFAYADASSENVFLSLLSLQSSRSLAQIFCLLTNLLPRRSAPSPGCPRGPADLCLVLSTFSYRSPFICLSSPPGYGL